MKQNAPYSHLMHLGHARSMGRSGFHMDTPATLEGIGTQQEGIVKSLETLTPKIEKQIEDLKAVTEKTAQIEARLVELNELRDGLKTVRLALKSRPGDFPGLEDEKTTFDMGKLMQLRLRAIDVKDCGFEMEVLQQTHKKYNRPIQTKDGIISTLTGSDGGIALPIEVSKQIIEAARAQSQLGKLGAYFPQLAGMSSFTVPLEEPTDLSQDGIIMQAEPTGEGSAFPVRSPKWKAESFAPKKLGMIIGVTNEFIKEGGQFLVDYVRNKAAEDMKNKLEFFALNGTGQEGQVPRGLLSRNNLAVTTLSQVIPANGRALSFYDLTDMEQTILEENRLVEGGKFGYYMRSSLLKGLRNQSAKTAEDALQNERLPITPLLFRSVKAIQEYVGYDMAYSTLIPKGAQGTSNVASTVVFGDFRYMWIPFWGPMEMLMSNVAQVGSTSAFSQDMTFVRFVQMYDVGVMAPNAFTKVFGFTPTTIA